MIEELLLSPPTKVAAQQLIKNPSHGLLITGPLGSGKYALARVVASGLLGFETQEKLDTYSYFTHVQKPEGKQDIPIEAIREVINSLKLKTPGSNDIRRVVVIEDAETLSAEAQNALLKMLEEPSQETVFILTTPSAQHVLPTIASRVQSLNVRPVSLESAVRYYGGTYDEKQIKEAWLLSGGAAGLMDALLKGSSDHPLKKAVDDVKRLLTQSTYERVLNLDALSKDKPRLALKLEALSRVLAALHHSAIDKEQAGRAAKLIGSRKLVTKLQKQLADNANPRLVALSLALNLKL